ncbi:hypothetical protein ACFHYQ_27765 [Sphaerimonospora cavernae]|uniref:Uncharacterized protein n=1 Tax=Sphaerimonospora cavernae TaxID=1740611 RepID=A0ABV6UD72_9ACTN
MAMDPRKVGLGRLKGVAGAAGRKVADSTSAARQRVADAAGDAQERVKQSAEQVKAKVTEAKDSLSARSSRNRADSADLSALSVDAKLLYCRVLVSLALVDALLDPREIANLYLFASTIGLDGEARSELRSGKQSADTRGAFM